MPAQLGSICARLGSIWAQLWSTSAQLWSSLRPPRWQASLVVLWLMRRLESRSWLVWRRWMQVPLTSSRTAWKVLGRSGLRGGQQASAYPPEAPVCQPQPTRQVACSPELVPVQRPSELLPGRPARHALPRSDPRGSAAGLPQGRSGPFDLRGRSGRAARRVVSPVGLRRSRGEAARCSARVPPRRLGCTRRSYDRPRRRGRAAAR